MQFHLFCLNKSKTTCEEIELRFIFIEKQNAVNIITIIKKIVF